MDAETHGGSVVRLDGDELFDAGQSATGRGDRPLPVTFGRVAPHHHPYGPEVRLHDVGRLLEVADGVIEPVECQTAGARGAIYFVGVGIESEGDLVFNARLIVASAVDENSRLGCMRIGKVGIECDRPLGRRQAILARTSSIDAQAHLRMRDQRPGQRIAWVYFDGPEA